MPLAQAQQRTVSRDFKIDAAEVTSAVERAVQADDDDGTPQKKRTSASKRPAKRRKTSHAGSVSGADEESSVMDVGDDE